jgi:hypothetical protein
VIVLLTLVTASLGIHDILSFGAIPNTDHLTAQQANTRAILSAIQAANSSQG